MSCPRAFSETSGPVITFPIHDHFSPERLALRATVFPPFVSDPLFHPFTRNPVSEKLSLGATEARTPTW